MDVPLYVTPFVWAMNKAKYDACRPARMKVIDDHCTTEWAEKVASPWRTSSTRPRQARREAGHEVYKLTPDQINAWRQPWPRRSAMGRRREEGGPGPEGVMDSLKASLVKYKAAL